MVWEGDVNNHKLRPQRALGSRSRPRWWATLPNLRTQTIKQETGMFPVCMKESCRAQTCLPALKPPSDRERRSWQRSQATGSLVPARMRRLPSQSQELPTFLHHLELHQHPEQPGSKTGTNKRRRVFCCHKRPPQSLFPGGGRRDCLESPIRILPL